MARTVRTKVYKFNELSSTAQSVAIECQRERISTEFIYREARETARAFKAVFGLRVGGRTFFDYEHSFSDDVLNLTGLRLRTYIINNYGSELYQGKYYSKGDRSRHSRIIMDNSCVLTGMCYDNSILQPVYDLIHKYRAMGHDSMDIKDLMDDCFSSLQKTLDKEEEYMNDDDHLIGEIEANELEFYESGKIYA